MYIIGAKCTFFLPYVSSLKEKRKVCKRIIEKSKNKFDVSIAEVGPHDVHQTLAIGLAIVSGEKHQAKKVIDSIIYFIENHMELTGEAEVQIVEMYDEFGLF